MPHTDLFTEFVRFDGVGIQLYAMKEGAINRLDAVDRAAKLTGHTFNDLATKELQDALKQRETVNEFFNDERYQFDGDVFSRDLFVTTGKKQRDTLIRNAVFERAAESLLKEYVERQSQGLVREILNQVDTAEQFNNIVNAMSLDEVSNDFFELYDEIGEIVESDLEAAVDRDAVATARYRTARKALADHINVLAQWGVQPGDNSNGVSVALFTNMPNLNQRIEKARTHGKEARLNYNDEDEKIIRSILHVSKAKVGPELLTDIRDERQPGCTFQWVTDHSEYKRRMKAFKNAAAPAYRLENGDDKEIRPAVEKVAHNAG